MAVAGLNELFGGVDAVADSCRGSRQADADADSQLMTESC